MIRSPLLPLALVALLTLWVRWYYVCRVNTRPCCSETTLSVPATGSLQLMRGQTVVLKGLPDLSFVTSEKGVTLTAASAAAVTQLAAYFSNNTDQALQIKGYFSPEEAGKSVGMFENLGVARAAALRDALAAKGLDEGFIRLTDGQSEDTSFTPVELQIIAADAIDNAGGEAQSFNNITFRDLTFGSGSAKFEPTASLIAYLDSLKSYELVHPDIAITVTGHTDDQGADAGNKKLGLQRAEAVKQFMNSKSIRAKIATDSKGEAEPLVANDNEANRKRNRRVNISF